MKNRPIICLIIALFYTHAIWADDEGETDMRVHHEAHFVDRAGYQYSYFDAPDNGGTIEVKAPKTHELVFRAIYQQPAGCPLGQFDQAFSVTPKGGNGSEYVVLCGFDEGHFPVIMIFEKGNLITSLDYLYDNNKMTWHPEFNTFQSVVYFEADFENTSNIPTKLYLERNIPAKLYEWDMTSIETINRGFQPVFNSHSYPFYKHRFFENRLKYAHDPSNSNRTGVMTIFSDLLATNKPSFICAELKHFPFKKMKTSLLQKMVGALEPAGFPSFEFSICK